MKRFIALLLALLLTVTVSVALTSCEDEETPKQEQSDGPIQLPFVPAS